MNSTFNRAGSVNEWEFYRQMYTIRRTEERLLELFSQGLLFGTVHTCIGQEACAVGVINAMDRQKDIIWSNHRGHGHYLAYCDDVEGLVAEIMGKSSGVCQGVGGSQHLHRDNFYTNGVLGGTVACAVGSAFAEKSKKSGALTVAFLGDGAMGEGIVYEALNMASLWKLPVLFVLEHNQYAQSTHYTLEHAGNLAQRASTFEIKTFELKADHVMDVCRVAQESIAFIHHHQQPVFLTLHTYRYAPHSKGDDNRSDQEIAAHRRSDPLQHLRWNLTQINTKRLTGLENEVEQRLVAAVEKAHAAPFLDASAFLQGVEQW